MRLSEPHVFHARAGMAEHSPAGRARTGHAEEVASVGQSNSNPVQFEVSSPDEKPTRRNHMSDFLKVLNERTSAENFDSARPISAQEIKELISEACQAPSAFNIQHWRFIA